MPSPKKARTVFSPESGALLLTAEESARYLHYHPVSIRRLVGKGHLRPSYRVGRALLFLREELDRFKRTSAAASMKGDAKPVPALAAAAPLPEGLRAVVVVRVQGRETVFSRPQAFRWDDVPAIRAEVRSKHGDASFFIAIAAPDGSGFELSFHSEQRRLPHHQALSSQRQGLRP
ncbi:MAG: helix-turn-helix domain-containing protein [Elusimicrobia bacterium]|nr:helix-turn-helix domain-containing protein [Elusimicrobiota bacterium]